MSNPLRLSQLAGALLTALNRVELELEALEHDRLQAAAEQLRPLAALVEATQRTEADPAAVLAWALTEVCERLDLLAVSVTTDYAGYTALLAREARRYVVSAASLLRTWSEWLATEREATHA